MSVMNVDFDKLRIILTPHVLRQGGLLSAVFAAAYTPLKRLYNTFVRYEADESRERQYGPAVRQLKAAIAYHLSIDEDLVLIEDVPNRDVLDLRRQSDAPSTRLELGVEPLPLWSDDMVWWNREFIVRIPDNYETTEIKNEIRSILDRWKMVSSRYTLIFYTIGS